MKSFKDEEIIDKRNEQKKQQYHSLEKGLFIKNSIVVFKKQTVLERLTAYFPDTWKQMPSDLAKIKYPSEFRPHQIMSSVDLGVNMGFSIFPSELQIMDVEQTAKRIMKTIYSENTGIKMEDFMPLKILDGYWFAFRSHAMDSDLYNRMLICPINGTIMQVSFNCPYEDLNDWEDAVILMWESIEFIRLRSRGI